MDMRPKTEAAFTNLLDTFTGADGGGRFVFLRSFVETLDAKAAAGDEAAKQVIEVVFQFSRLINLAYASYTALTPKTKRERRHDNPV